jgi:hypothetical protein
VQSRRRFPKEGKILVTTRGEEKVVACDIFNERVTLRTVDGDTRVVALAELKAEMGGAEHSGGAEERGLAASTAEYAIETAAAMAELEPQSMSMLDTMEFEAFTATQAVEGEAEVEVAAEAAVETPTEAVAVDSAATEGAPKRKRRRGRRGGRRLRAAEERRKAGDEPQNSDDSDPADDSHTDDDGV